MHMVDLSSSVYGKSLNSLVNCKLYCNFHTIGQYSMCISNRSEEDMNEAYDFTAIHC